jgi:predicted ATP-grasp superfamily ATP-dependent carboligase
MMRDAALRDFAQIPGIEILMTCDQRLTAPFEAHQVLMIDVTQDVWVLWEQHIDASDAVLLIAPETNGVLERLTRLAEKLNKVVLGSGTSAIKLAGDKWTTYQSFISHHISTLDTYLANNLPNPLQGPFIAKPRVGAGCDDMAYFEDVVSLQAWLKGREHTHLVQPYQIGDATSFSMLCKKGKAYLLSCNRQNIQIAGQEVSYHGGVMNGMDEHRAAFNTLAKKIAQAMPDLAGYVGVDLIVHQDVYFVLEVNPRLTTSYVTLHEACGCNPAQMLLNLFYNEAFIMPVITHHKVEISINAAAITN